MPADSDEEMEDQQAVQSSKHVSTLLEPSFNVDDSSKPDLIVRTRHQDFQDKRKSNHFQPQND